MTAGRQPRSLGRRVRARIVVAASWLACRLPEGPLLALADLAGRVWYRLAPERRMRARKNLTRVCRWLADHELGTPAARAAARDGRALNRLVRDAFRYSARYYVQLARAPLVDAAYLERWLVIEDRGVIDAALDDPQGSLFVSMHLSWFELAAVYAAARTGRPTLVPSETIDDPELQSFLVRTRAKLGLELIELSGAKRRLTDALRQGQTVGILGDRDITGGGIEVELFGARSPLAAGPALLAMETGVTPHVFGVWRDEAGVYHGRAEQVPFPADGTRRERVTRYLEAEARAFERHIAAAPEQWLAVFHPIWPDLETVAANEGAGAGASPKAGPGSSKIREAAR